MLKFEFALTLLFILGILTSAKRELLVSKSELSYSYSYSYEDELIGYVTTNVYLFNENQDYDLWVNVIDSTDTELSGEYLEKIVYGEYGTFTVSDQEFNTTIYYDSESGGNIYEDNIVYITMKAPDQYTLQSSVTYISRDGKFEFSYVSAYDADLDPDGTSFTAVANLTISANLPDDFSYSYSYSFDY
mmetsp:Transcript_39739/g.52386  ORF Transcript_39739/g.52386 Transcript_39739/m.52386 type:complete len:188 (-) Transcript_39739:301-864(-)|eukprot:CAMPEP_0117754056 /NCGR_PEP_ID=MMETSP0947-20121206/12603_1 /TAXON_ID=44440 /ORGANISM="Chattonella subsalsa, Strain CCMP2191" /LENGTH=187 /DNA_ID=CAMNT_0005573075 /DNA_START=299 /DNA_END=862 /DNA_ORIENTATION=+